MSIDGTRVLKAHKEAVKAALADNLQLLQAGHLDDAAANIAEAVLTALDVKATYVVLVRDGSATRPLLVYGSYASVKTANKAAQSGHMGTAPGAQLVGVFPVLAAPRRGAIEREGKNE